MPIVDDATTVLARAEAVSPTLQEQAAAGEHDATLTAESVQRLSDAGLFRLGLPRSLGGWEVEPATFTRVVERLSFADGSAGWSTFIGNSSTFFAWLDPTVARSLVGDEPDRVSTSVFTPSGTGVVENGGYRLSGRWAMNSGAPHATWFCNGFVVDDDRAGAATAPSVRWAVYPATDAEIIPTWNGAMGLRATGSHDVVVDKLWVPAELTLAPFEEPPHHHGPLYSMPFASLLHVMMIGFPLGVGRRALDEFAVLAARSARRPATHRLAEDPDVQTQLGLAEAGLRSARSYAYDAISRVSDEVACGDVSPAARADLALAIQQAMRSALAATDTVYSLCGVSTLKAGDVVQRCWRDLHAGAHHIVFAREGLRRGARALLGLPQDETHL